MDHAATDESRTSIHSGNIMPEVHAILRPLPSSRMLPTSEPNRPPAIATDLNGLAFDLSYDSLQASLSIVPRLYIEPDGSFVWVSAEDPERKLYGQITDNGHQVVFVEIRATCLFGELRPLLGALGWPETQMGAQLLPSATIMTMEDFSRHMSGPPNS